MDKNFPFQDASGMLCVGQSGHEMYGEGVRFKQGGRVFYTNKKQTSRLFCYLQEIDTINLTGRLALETLAFLVIRILIVVWIRHTGAGVSRVSGALSQG